MLDLGVPLKTIMSVQMRSFRALFDERSRQKKLTLALTLSKLALLTMEKQIKNTSVWGYDNGRRRS